MCGRLSRLSMEHWSMLHLSPVYSGGIPRRRAMSRQGQQEIHRVCCEMDWAQ